MPRFSTALWRQMRTAKIAQTRPCCRAASARACRVGFFILAGAGDRPRQRASGFSGCQWGCLL